MKSQLDQKAELLVAEPWKKADRCLNCFCCLASREVIGPSSKAFKMPPAALEVKIKKGFDLNVLPSIQALARMAETLPGLSVNWELVNWELQPSAGPLISRAPGNIKMYGPQSAFQSFFRKPHSTASHTTKIELVTRLLEVPRQHNTTCSASFKDSVARPSAPSARS